MDKSKAIILDYFITEVVDGWMLTDLERLTSIPHRSGAAGNCNFPIALYTFACVEFLGQLTYSEKSLPNQGYTQASIMGFIDDFFPDDFKEDLKPHRKNFVNIFRNGLAHNYFAKAAGVSRTKANPFSIENNHLVLDADQFAKDFKSAVETLKKMLKTDEKLLDRMVTRYNTQFNGNLKFKVAPDVAKLYSTPVSGASLPHPSMVKNLKTMVSTSTSTSPKVTSSKTTTTLPPWLDQDNDD